MSVHKANNQKDKELIANLNECNEVVVAIILFLFSEFFYLRDFLLFCFCHVFHFISYYIHLSDCGLLLQHSFVQRIQHACVCTEESMEVDSLNCFQYYLSFKFCSVAVYSLRAVVIRASVENRLSGERLCIWCLALFGRFAFFGI